MSIVCPHLSEREFHTKGYTLSVELYESTIDSWTVDSKEQFTIETEDGEITEVIVNGETKFDEDNLTENMMVSLDSHTVQRCVKCGWREPPGSRESTTEV